MKKSLTNVALWIGIILLSVGVALAQDSRIVHYDTDASASSKRPDFKGALIAIEFGGTVGMNAKALFMKLGARDFVQGDNPCVIARDVVCAQVTVGEPQAGTFYSQTNGGGGFGFSVGGSFSGEAYPITLHVLLIKYDKENRRQQTPIELGEAMSLAQVGSGTSYSSSYGRHGGGSSSSSSTTSLNGTMGGAADQDVNRLLHHNGLVRFFSGGAYAKWVPGADSAVKEAFQQ
jgi:hypothetical protein